MKGKRGNILTENIIFLILNLVFIAILLTFVFTRAGTGALLEEEHAKQIALMIDSASPGMELKLEMGDAFEEAEKNGLDSNEIILKEKNVITVKLSSDSRGYSYSYFNDVSVGLEPYKESGSEGYIFVINEKEVGDEQ